MFLLFYKKQKKHFENKKDSKKEHKLTGKKDLVLLLTFRLCHFFKPDEWTKIPDTIKNIPIRENSNVKVWLNDVMELAVLLISEKCIRHPHFSGICHCQVFDAAWKFRNKSVEKSLNGNREAFSIGNIITSKHKKDKCNWPKYILEILYLTSKTYPWPPSFPDSGKPFSSLVKKTFQLYFAELKKWFDKTSLRSQWADLASYNILLYKHLLVGEWSKLWVRCSNSLLFLDKLFRFEWISDRKGFDLMVWASQSGFIYFYTANRYVYRVNPQRFIIVKKVK